jgi:hypothetical protein
MIVKVTYSGHAWRRHKKFLSTSNSRHGNLRVGGGGDIGRAVLALFSVVSNDGPCPCLGVVFVGHAAGQDLTEIHRVTTTFLHGWVLVWIMLEGMILRSQLVAGRELVPGASVVCAIPMVDAREVE